MAASVNNHGAFVWAIAEMLRGDYTQSDYQKVILPLVAIKRLDAVLEPTKDAVLDKLAKRLTTQLSLLTEYREALITAAVTGEIDGETFDNDRDLEAVAP